MDYELEQCGNGGAAKKNAGASSKKTMPATDRSDSFFSKKAEDNYKVSDEQINALLQEQAAIAVKERRSGMGAVGTGADSILDRLVGLNNIASKSKPNPKDLDALAEFWSQYSRGASNTKPGREAMAQYALRIYNNTTETGRNRLAVSIGNTQNHSDFTPGQKAFNDLIVARKEKIKERVEASGGIMPDASNFQVRYTTGGRSKSTDSELNSILDLF